MNGSKLSAMLQLLTRKEWAQLEKFVASGLYNPNPHLAGLLQVLITHGLDLRRAAIWRLLFNDLAYDDLVLRRLMSELLALVAQFLSEADGLGDKARQLQLLQVLRSREAAQLYEFYYRKMQRDAEAATPLLNSGSLLDDYLLQAERNAWLERSANRSGVTNLDASVASLDRFYLFNKLKYACTRLNNRNVMGGEFQDPFLEGLLKQLPTSHFSDDPAILIYLQIYQMLSRPEEERHYPVLREMLAAHAGLFSADEARHLYAFAMNHCIGRINAGQGDFLAEIFGLYKAALSRNVLFEGESLSPWDYKNIVVVGLRLSEFDWVEEFIRSYQSKIPLEHRENAFTYNLAKLHFYKKHYSEVLKLLQQLEYEDVFYNLDAKTMLLKIYFEQQEIEALDSLIESFRTFLRRNKLISASHRTNYLNLILFVKKLSRVRYGDHQRIAKIKRDFEATRQIADADWLREKMGE